MLLPSCHKNTYPSPPALESSQPILDFGLPMEGLTLPTLGTGLEDFRLAILDWLRPQAGDESEDGA